MHDRRDSNIVAGTVVIGEVVIFIRWNCFFFGLSDFLVLHCCQGLGREFCFEDCIGVRSRRFWAERVAFVIIIVVIIIIIIIVVVVVAVVFAVAVAALVVNRGFV